MNGNANTCERSAFVTGLSWVLIIFCGFGCLVGLMQIVMFETVFPQEAFEHMQSQTEFEDLPFIFRLLSGNFKVMMYFNFSWMALWFVAGLNLRKRREWARKAVSALFLLLVIFIVAMPVMQYSALSWMGEKVEHFEGMEETGEYQASTDIDTADGFPQDPRAEFEKMRTVMLVMSGVFFLIFAVLFGFVFWKLRSEEVRAEFA